MAKKQKTRGTGALPFALSAVIGGAVVAGLMALKGSTRARRETDPDTGGRIPRDLALDRPHPEPDDRAPDAFRPDPTAAIPAGGRDAFAPATRPTPNARAGTDAG